MRCADCRFWVSISNNGKPTGSGDCHRYPPTPVCRVDWEREEGKYYAKCAVEDFYPTTDDWDFCGEFAWGSDHVDKG